MRRETKSLPKVTNISLIAQGALLLLFSLLFSLSLVSYRAGNASQNLLGLTGYITSWFFYYLFGFASWIIPTFCGFIGIKLLLAKPIFNLRSKCLYAVIMLISTSILLAQLATFSPLFSSFFRDLVYSGYYPKNAISDPYKLRHYIGGVPFHRIYVDTAWNLRNIFGSIGTFLISSSLLFSSVVLITNIRLISLVAPLINIRKKKPIFQQGTTTKMADILKRDDPLKKTTSINIVEKPKSESRAETAVLMPKRVTSLDEYTLPPASLLTEVSYNNSSTLKSDLQKQATILEETLLSFGIEAKVGDIHCGPTITALEVHPATGVKVQKIKALENDIALNMQAKSIRIIAPIPGKAAVGIEVPNLYPQEVSFRDLLENYRKSNKKAHIPLLLGKVVNGDDIWTDLTKMPHLIIAGATGSGKSVCINTLVTSIIMNARPDEIKIVMVDPKKVELTAYTHLPHMLAPVITEPGGACAALGWLVKEMEMRYEIFRQLGSRNILGFNTRKINKNLEESLDLKIPEKMPYIVVIIDELADLMIVSSSDIETPIARIAQMARAVGIHMILATQRPSREVITGLIKANFPCRIAFKVASRVNSQIIIDENGAETLLGNGDMLFMPPGTASVVRAQGAFIRDDDINRIINYVCSQAPTQYVIPSFDTYKESSESSESFSLSNLDTLYKDAEDLVLKTGNASTTFLQRKLKIGYARAASLMDQLEANGVIGPSEGAKPRKIYYTQKEE